MLQTQAIQNHPSPLKAAGEAPTAPNPPELNLNPVAEGAVVGPPDAGVDVEAEGSAKENCGSDGAAGRVDGASKEKVSAGFTTGGGAGAGAGVSTIGGGFMAFA